MADLQWTSKSIKSVPEDTDQLLIIDNVDGNNRRITLGTLPSAALPVPDTTPIVEGSSDSSKLLRFEIDGFVGGGIRILTPPDANGVIVLEDVSQILTNKTITAAANFLSIASTDLTDTANIVLNNQINSYDAGSKQNFLGDTSGTAGLNVGGILGNPTTQTDGDLWLNTSTNTLFARINSTNVDISAAGEVFTWTADHDAGTFDLLNVGGITINNPGNTFQYILTSAAILDDRTLTLPLLTANDTLVTEAFAQTLTGKTIDGDDNTISNIDETMQTVDVGAIGTVLTSIGAGSPPQYLSAGSQTPIIQDVNYANFSMTNVDAIGFNGTGASAGDTIPNIYSTAAGMFLNVPSTLSFHIDVDGTEEYAFSATALDMQDNILSDVGNIILAETLIVPGSTLHSIYVDTGGIIFHTTSGDDFDFQFGSNSKYTFDENNADWQGNNLIQMGVLSFIDVNTSLTQTGLDLLIDVASSGSINLRVNDTLEYDFTASQADFKSNSIIAATINAALQTSVTNISETMQIVTAGAGGTVLTSNGAGFVPSYQSIAGTGDVVGPGSATDDAIARFDTATGKLIQNGVITIDDNANVELIRSLQFTSHTSAPSPTIEYIAVVNSDFEINVIDGHVFKLEVDETDEYVFNQSAADFKSNNLIMGNSYIQVSSIGTPGTTGSATTGKIFLDSGNDNHLSIIRNLGIVDLESGSQTPWIENINAAGFDLQSLSNLEFQNTSGVPTISTPAIYVFSGDMILNVADANFYNFEINGSSEYTFSATQADFQNNAIIDLNRIEFNGAGTTPVATVQYITGDAAGIEINAPTGDVIDLKIAGNESFQVSSSEVSFKGLAARNAAYLRIIERSTAPPDEADLGTLWVKNDVPNTLWFTDEDGTDFQLNVAAGIAAVVDDTSPQLGGTLDGNGFDIQLDEANEITFDGATATQTISGSAGGLTFILPTSDIYDFVINSTSEYTFSESAADFNDNSITNATIDGDLNTILDINETQMNVSVGVADTLLTSNGVGVAPTYQSLFPINFPENAGGNATVTQDIDFSINDRHSQQYTLTQNTTLTFSGTVASTTEYVDLFIVQDGTGGWTLTLPIGTVNKTEVEAGINLGAGGETSILLKFAFGTFYAFLQGSSSASEVFTWTADHSMATFKLTATAANDVILNAPTGQGVSIEVAATEQYLFNATLANFNGSNLQNVPQILDSNGEELLIFTTTASAVNELTLVNAASGNAVELRATGDNTNVDVKFVPKGTGTFYGNRETWSWPLTDETTAPSTGVKYTTEPAPYTMTIEDAIAGLTIAGTTSTFTLDVLMETLVDSNSFATIFSTLLTTDATKFTSTNATTPPVLSTTTWLKGKRLQLSITTLDTGGTARGVKISLITHATAK